MKLEGIKSKFTIERVGDLVEIFWKAYCQCHQGYSKNEYIFVASINDIGRVVSVDLIEISSPEKRSIPIRYIIAPVLRENCWQFAVCHNHPSGCAEPSLEDIQFTKNLKEVSKMLGLNFVDHIILTDEGYYFSFTEAGKWVFKELEKFEKEKQKEKELEFKPLKPHMTDLKNASKYLRT